MRSFCQKMRNSNLAFLVKSPSMMNWDITVYAVATAMSAALGLNAQAEPPPRSFSHPITSAEQATAMPMGEKVVMVCSKCKTIQLAEVEREKSFLRWFQPKTKHVCPGCGGHWGYVVYGKGSRHGDWVHTCSKCGDKSIFCCATTNGKRTPGM